MASSLRINSSGILSTPNVFDETQVLAYTLPGQTAPGSIQLANTLTTSTVSNNYVTTANSALFALTSIQDFTIECWIYPTNISDSEADIFQWQDSSPDAPYYYGYNLFFNSQTAIEPGALNLSINGAGTGGDVLGIINYNAWNHVVMMRHNNLIYLGTNGSMANAAFWTGIGSDSSSTSFGSILVGKNLQNSTANPPAYVTNVRVVKGTSVYPYYPSSSIPLSYPVPTSPLTNITSTALLLTMNNSSSYLTDSSDNNLSVTAPNANVSFNTASPFTFTPITLPVTERTTSTSYQISGILDETKTLTYNSLPVAKRIDKNGNLYVSGYLDEYNTQ